MAGLDAFLAAPQPTPMRPLLGLTVLLVEDSRFTCEAMRLLCTRSGARIRRADSLASARKHLSVYHPSVVIADVGLPDGSGIGLIEALVLGTPRIDVIIGISGEPQMEEAVLAAGADDFIAKPIESLAAFQATILKHLPADRQPTGPRPVGEDLITPDPMAFHDDLNHVAELLTHADKGSAVDYVTQFLSGVALSAADEALADAVNDLANARASGRPVDPELAAVCALVKDRLAAAGPL